MSFERAGLQPDRKLRMMQAASAAEGNVKPSREIARNNHQTYFLTFTTEQRKPFFRNERWAVLLTTIIERYAIAGEYKLHDFVVMPDHLHLLVTPNGALERTAQLVKGGYSFQAKRAFKWTDAIWLAGFSDHRIRDWADWEQHIAYINKNLNSLKVEDYVFCGRSSRLVLAPAPQWLKPHM